MERKLLGIISVDFDATDQLLIICFAFVIYWEWEYNDAVHQLFIDFKKAYDSVRREILCNILIEFAIPLKLVRLIKESLTETYSRIQVGKHLSDVFPIRNGLKQGDDLSPWIFNFALEYAIRRAWVNQDGLKLMVHISFWFMLMMIIYWAEVYIL